MKKIFTFLTACMLLTSSAFAQNATLTVETPNGTTTYEALGAAFGPSACDLSAMGSIGIVDDGEDPNTDACTPLVNDLTGQVALLDRGTCNFSLKCYNAQAAGAMAVIVCNNVDDPIITMAAGDSSDQIVIPCIMLARQDCEMFRAESSLTGTIAALTIAEDTNINVIWDDGQFDAGLGDWTVNNITCGNGATGVDMWSWTADGSVPGSCGGGQITSPTNCGGAMGFSSDYLDSGDGACGSGGAACGAPQVGELVSPPIDLTNVDVPGVSLYWWQNSRQFTSTYIVSFTTDDGETWNDITVNGEYVTNDPATNENRRVFLPGAVGNVIRVKFRYEANYYYWIVDDVKLIETEANNLQVDPFFAVPNNAQVPASQVEPVYFLADVRNVGSKPQDNVNLNMTVTDAAGNEVYTEDLAYNTIDAAGDVQNVPFAGSWTPPAIPGVYTGTYSISADSMDFDMSNNTQSFSMTVTDSIFAKDNGATRFLSPGTANWDDGAPHSWGMGNVYHVVNDTGMDGHPMYATSVSVGIGNRNVGLVDQSVTVWLYEWADANADGNAQDSERTRVAFNQIIFDGDGSGTPTDITYNVPLINFSSGQVENIPLKADTDYIIFMEYTDQTDETEFEIVAGDDIDYGAQVFLNSPFAEDPDGNLLGVGVGSPRNVLMLGLPADGSFASEVEYDGVGFGRNVVPIAHINVQEIPPVSAATLSDDNIVNVFPNPVQNQVNLQLDLVNMTAAMNIRIINTRGQEMLNQDYKDVQTQNLFFDVNNYASGTYYLSITTDEGVKMKKFIVQR